MHDHLLGDSQHRYEARWHLPAEADGHVSIVRGSDHTVVTTPVGNLTIASPATVEIEPGWISPTYGILQPAPVVVIHASGSEADILTVLSPGDVEVSLVDHTEHGRLHCVVERNGTSDLILWTTPAVLAWERRNA